MDPVFEQKLSAGEARKLSQFLRSSRCPPNTLSLNQLKGLLFCICTTPTMINPSQWLPEVFGGTMLEFRSQDDAWIIQSILRLYNQINREVLNGNPKLPPRCQLDQTAIADNFRPGSALHEWCSGFDQGMHLVANAWQSLPFDDASLQDELTVFWLNISFFADEKRARDLFKQERNLPITEVDPQETPFFINYINHIRDDLPWLIKDYAALTQALFEATMALEENDQGLTHRFGSEEDYPDTAFSLNEPDPEALVSGGYDPKTIVINAQKALKADPLDVYAWLDLAQWDSASLSDRITHLESAVNAGEQRLGEAFFQEYEGHFWLISETRPFMTALAELAEAYSEDKKPTKAMALFERALRLNPNDNQGVRYRLLALYLNQQLLPQARTLLNQYADDMSASFVFNRLLLDYIEQGDTPETRAERRAAKQYNRHVARLLSGKDSIPDRIDDHYTPGDRNEAVFYFLDHQNLWRNVIGAIAWLQRPR